MRPAQSPGDLRTEEMNLICEGPQAQDRSERQRHFDEFVEKLYTLYPGHILIIALYGSMARNQDGPYSDIELFCIVNLPGMDTTFGRRTYSCKAW